jgi:divalent metal cation (Fe/Co/Zn/Cd) transporter
MPQETFTGIILAVVSLVVMPVLAWQKNRRAHELDSRALQADSTQTSLCSYRSAFLLVGLLTNALLGWWWADPVAGLAIALFAAKEGRELSESEQPTIPPREEVQPKRIQIETSGNKRLTS